MSKVAVGAYLRVLRLDAGLGRPTVANMIKTSEGQIRRVEIGEQDSRGSLLLAFCRAVKGNPKDIERLTLDEDATAEDGEETARNWINLRTEWDQWLNEAPDLKGFVIPEELDAEKIQDLLQWLKCLLRWRDNGEGHPPNSSAAKP